MDTIYNEVDFSPVKKLIFWSVFLAHMEISISILQRGKKSVSKCYRICKIFAKSRLVEKQNERKTNSAKISIQYRFAESNPCENENPNKVPNKVLNFSHVFVIWQMHFPRLHYSSLYSSPSKRCIVVDNNSHKLLQAHRSFWQKFIFKSFNE